MRSGLPGMGPVSTDLLLCVVIVIFEVFEYLEQGFHVATPRFDALADREYRDDECLAELFGSGCGSNR